MEDLNLYFSPVAEDVLLESPEPQQFQAKSRLHLEGDFPELEGVKVAIFGVREQRNSSDNAGTKEGAHEVRRFLYKLFCPWDLELADLGDIEAGDRVEDTYFAVSRTVETLIKQNILPVIIGGSQDLTYANYLAYERLEQTVNIVSIDPRLDIGDVDNPMNSEEYLSKIILHQPNYLFNYSNIGYQSYLVNPALLELMENLYFDFHRLGAAQGDISSCEPVVRNADMVSVDVSAIRQSEAPGCNKSGPNGFYGEEICQLSRYIGMSDKLTSWGIYDYNPLRDDRGHTAHLVAQMIWCFLDGFAGRKRDFPIGGKSKYTKYRVDLEESHELIFYKSDKSERWWMEVPYPSDQQRKYERHHMVPCEYKDYEEACKNEIPDRWINTHKKLV